MNRGYTLGPVWALLVTLFMASPAILATATVHSGASSIESIDFDVEIDLPDGSGDMPSGEFFVSPLTNIRYIIRKDLEAEKTLFCRTDDGVCYESTIEILDAESENMPDWMLKVEPTLRENIAGALSDKGPQDSEINVVIELDERHFHNAAIEVWHDTSGELNKIVEEQAEVSPSRTPNPYDIDTGLDENLLNQLDLLLDDARSEIYLLADEMTMPLISRLTHQISELGGRVISHTPVLPALFATVPARAIPSIALLEGVGRITEDGVMHAMMDISTYAMGADMWWSNGFSGGTWDLAIVDTGIDGTHPTLTVDAAQVFHAQAQGFPGYNDNPSDPDDLLGHGTHLAGTVASVHGTYRGVSSGMDGLINAKAGYRLTVGGASMSWSDGMSAVDWAISSAGADAISFSFGGSPGAADTPYSRFYDAVVDDLGVMVVIAAGNDGPAPSTVSNPACAYNVIAVGSVNDWNSFTRSDDTLVPFSSRGPTGDGRLKPDILAPGENIISTSHNWESAPDFTTMSGTSTATPHIAASLLLLMDGMGGMFSVMLKALLLNTADDLGATGPDNNHGWGYVNLADAYIDRNYVYNSSIDDSAQGYAFFKGPVGAGQKGTVVWNRHVTYDGASFPVTYYALNDLDLYAYNELDNFFVESSTSAINNVEQIVANINYGSFVYKVKSAGTFVGVTQERFAFAAEGLVSPASPPAFTYDLSYPSPAELGVQFAISANITNTGDLSAHNVQATLNLPAGLSLVSGSATASLGTIGAGSTTVPIWPVRGDITGTMNVSVDVISNSYGETFSQTGAIHFVEVADTTPPVSSVDPLPPLQCQPTFTVTVTASDANTILGITLYFKRNGGPYNAYSFDGAPPWSWLFDTSLTGGEGIYEFYSVAQDAALNLETVPIVPDAMTVLDCTAPTSAVDILPSYITSVVFPVTVTASDASSGISRVDLYYRKDGLPWIWLGPDTLPPWDWSFDSLLAGGDGFYEFYSVATDNASNSETVPFSPDTSTLVDTMSPSSMVNALPSNESTAFLVSANANDATSGLEQVALLFRRNGGPWMVWGFDFLSPWNWNFNTASIGGDGFYEFYTIATDIASNVEPVPTLPDTTTTVDTVDPISSADALPQYETSSSFIITATASDATSGISTIDLYFRKDMGTWTKYRTDTSPPWSWDFDSDVSGKDGFYEYYTIATDHSSNIEPSPAIADTSVTVDTTEPTSTAEALPAYKTVKTFTINATADDAMGLEEVELWFRKDGGGWTLFGDATSSPWSWEFNTSMTGGDGEYEYFTRARDVVGHYEDAPSWPDTVTEVDTLTPVVFITSPQEGEWLTFRSINVFWTGADGGSGIDYYEIKLDEDIWINTGAVISRLYENVMDGVHNATARVRDKAGNMQVTSVWFGVDSTNPVVVIESPDDGSTVTSPTIRVTWSGSDAASGIDHYEVKMNGRSFKDVGMETSHRLDGVSDGRHTVVVRAVDVAGNFVDVTADVRVDTNPLSPGGPFMGVPLYLLIVIIAVLLLFVFLRWRKPKDEEVTAKEASKK